VRVFGAGGWLVEIVRYTTVRTAPVRLIAALGAVALIVWWSGRSLTPYIITIAQDIDRFGRAAPIAFIAIYAVAIVALVPATILTLIAGAVFGVVRGVAYAFVGATIGTTAAFLLGRHAARPIVERWLHAAPRFVAVDRAVSAQGRRIVFLLRLSPIMPFNLLNYALGLTTISVWDFVIAGAGSLPSEFLAAYAGRVTGEALALAEQAEVPKNASYYAVLLGGLAATVAATLLVTRTARRALRDV
jgi:uncharacterized membrane protein YdjX (TVP38/TMEM64 family)